MLLPFSLLQVVDLLLPISLLAGTAVASHAGFHVKQHGTGYRHAAGTGSLKADDINVTTTNDLAYTVEITLGGEQFTVLLDTGSTDLWVKTDGRKMSLTNTTDLDVGIGYGRGEIEGKIDFAELKIGDFVIESQAFINPTSIVDIDTTDMDGIMGMAFDVANIYSTIQRAWGTEAADELGRAPITSLFAQDPSLPNNFDVQLGRTSELEDIADGTFIISGHEAEFEAVTKAPQLPRIDSAHWSIVMDGMLINGKQFAFNKSRIVGAPSGTIVAALDTGFSFPPLPPAAVDAIYSTIPGAAYDPVAQFWLLPCTAATNLSFIFGGQEFPIHPLDLTFPLTTGVEVNGTIKEVTVCINTYQYLDLDPTKFVGFDIILGDAFLRNVYASFDYGDYYPANRTNGLPFVQMLSTTNTSTMWHEFEQERALALAELPEEMSPALLVAYDIEQAQKAEAEPGQLAVHGAASSEDDEDGSGSGAWFKKNGVIVLALLGANLLVGVAIFAVTLTMCVRGMKGKSGPRYAPVRFKTMDKSDMDDHERGTARYSD